MKKTVDFLSRIVYNIFKSKREEQQRNLEMENLKMKSERVVRRIKGHTITKDGYGMDSMYRLYSPGCMTVAYEIGSAAMMLDYMKVVHGITITR
jgi:hypothetical protein